MQGHASPSQDDEIALVPMECLSDAKINTINEMSRHTSDSLYVAQSTLTTSQKKEFRTVNLSSEGDDGSDECILNQLLRNEKSSGTTTVAFTTPSAYASSGIKASGRQDLAETSSAKRRRTAVEIDSDPVRTLYSNFKTFVDTNSA